MILIWWKDVFGDICYLYCSPQSQSIPQSFSNWKWSRWKMETTVLPYQVGILWKKNLLIPSDLFSLSRNWNEKCLSLLWSLPNWFYKSCSGFFVAVALVRENLRELREFFFTKSHPKLPVSGSMMTGRMIIITTGKIMNVGQIMGSRKKYWN